tara:strand:- start:258 stop:2999 length:2742 start_codon:yes stop_codon:yes gene_type:complete
MATTKFTDLPSSPSQSIANNDVIAIVDVASNTSKQTTVVDLGGAISSSGVLNDFTQSSADLQITLDRGFKATSSFELQTGEFIINATASGQNINLKTSDGNGNILLQSINNIEISSSLDSTYKSRNLAITAAQGATASAGPHMKFISDSNEFSGFITASDAALFESDVTINGNLVASNSKITAKTGSFSRLKGNSPLIIEGIVDLTPTAVLNISGSVNVNGAPVVTEESGSMNFTGSNATSGSSEITGSQIILGSSEITGSFVTSGSAKTIGILSTLGSNIITGSSITSGSFNLEGPSKFTGSLSVTGSLNLEGGLNLTNSPISSSSPITASSFVTSDEINTSGTNITLKSGSLDRIDITPTEILIKSTENISFGNNGMITSLQMFGDITASKASNVLKAGISASGAVTASGFKGDGSNLTGVTADWDGTHSGSAEITGSLDVSGSITASGDLKGFNLLLTNGGSLANPAIRLSNDPNNGIYFSAPDNILFVNGGATSLSVNENKIQAYREFQATNITSSGFISASGNITASNLDLNGGSVNGNNGFLDLKVNGAQFMSMTGDSFANRKTTFLNQRFIDMGDSGTGTNVIIHGNLTASLISSSDTISAVDLNVSGSITSGAISSSAIVTMSSASIGGAIFTSASLAAAAAGNLPSLSTDFPARNITASGAISASGTIIGQKIESEQLFSRLGDANTGLQLASDTVQIEANDQIIAVFATSVGQRLGNFSYPSTLRGSLVNISASKFDINQSGSTTNITGSTFFTGSVGMSGSLVFEGIQAIEDYANHTGSFMVNTTGSTIFGDLNEISTGTYLEVNPTSEYIRAEGDLFLSSDIKNSTGTVTYFNLDSTGGGAIKIPVPISASAAISCSVGITSSGLIVNSGEVNFLNLPTVNPGVAGRLWRDGTDLKISTGP